MHTLKRSSYLYEGAVFVEKVRSLKKDGPWHLPYLNAATYLSTPIDVYIYIVFV